MQSRKDQVQAHMFVMGRLTSGVLRLEPDGLDQPVSRTGRGALGGIAVAVLACLVIALFAFIVPGGNTVWKQSGTLVMVKDTGARFLSIDGVLHPVLNLASARLLAGDNLKLASMSAKSLRDAPRGAEIGLIGAPDSLPAADALTGQTWDACAVRSASEAQSTATPAGLSLVIGGASSGFALDSGSAIAVTGSDGFDYLLWNGERLRVDRSNDVLQAIGAGATTLPLVPAAFLDVVPAGPDLAVPTTGGAGGPGPVLAGKAGRIGQLFADSRQNHYLLTQQGLVALTPTLFELYQADPRTQTQAYGGKAITVGQLGPNDLSDHLAPDSATAALTHQNQLPVNLPQLRHLSPDQAVCEQTVAGRGPGAGSTVVADTDAVVGRPPDGSAGITASCLPAQTVRVEPGHGALVAATLSGGGAGPSYYVVTDAGVKYPIPSSDALSALGYGDAPASAVSNSWMNLLPTGPVLDPTAVSTVSTVAPSAGRPGCSVVPNPARPGSSATVQPGEGNRQKGQTPASAKNGTTKSP